MYICSECLETFVEPKHWVEKHGLDSPPYEEWDGCPHCGGAYRETIFCDGCEKPIVEVYVQLKNGEKYCENCFRLENIWD